MALVLIAATGLLAGLPDIVYTSGAYTYKKSLIKVPGKGLGFDFNVEFNSRRDSVLLSLANTSRSPWRMGKKWLHSYQWSMLFDSVNIAVYRPDGGVELFWSPKTASGAYNKSPWVKSCLIDTSGSADSAKFIYRTKDRSSLLFNKAGRLVRMKDPTGYNSLAFTYVPASGDTVLSSITDTRGNTATFYYDRTTLTSVVYRVIGSADSLSVSFDYASDGNLRKITDVNKDSTAVEIDNEGNIVYIVNGLGDTSVRNVYQDVKKDGSASRLKKQYDAKGDSTMYDYISRKAGDYSSDSILTVTDRSGVKQVIKYTTLQQVASGVDSGSGKVENHWYDSHGNDTMDYFWSPFKMSGGAENGYYERKTFDTARGNLTRKARYTCKTCPISTSSAIYAYSYDSLDHVIVSVGPTGDSVRYKYNNANNPNLLSQSTDAYNNTTAYSYDTKGQLTQQTDPDGQDTKNDYSDAGDLLTTVDPNKDTLRYSYDAFGRRTMVLGARKDTTRTFYDRKGRPVMEINALGDTTRSVYDCEDRLVSMTVPSGATTRFRYTKTGQKSAIINACGDSSTTVYDQEDRPVTVTDELGRSTKYAYDKAGRVISVNDPMNRVFQYAYDTTGNLTRVTDAKGNTTLYGYDSLNRTVKTTDPLGFATFTHYDFADRPDSSSNARGQATIFTYDKTGRILKKRLPGRVISIVYSAIMGKDSLIVDSSATGIDTTLKVFDRYGRLVRRTDKFGKTIGYHYDPANNLDTIIYSDGKKAAYTYDLLNRMTQVRDWAGRTTRYAYDKDGKLARMVLPDGATVRITRDIMGRITAYRDSAAAGGIIYSATVALDKLGLRANASVTEPMKPALNSFSKTMSYDRADRLILADTARYSYDADGNMTGGVLNGKPVALAYDPTSQLVSVGKDLYVYDAEEARVQATISGKTVRYVYDINSRLPSVLEETDTAGVIISRYVYGIGLISREDARGTASVYHFDLQGNTLALTDISGAITDKYAYTLYGALVGSDGATLNMFKFSGRSGVIDDGNGLYYMRARYYSPELMRFVQQERVRGGDLGSPQTLNRYAYVTGNPVNYIDPSGEWLGIDDLVATIGGAIIGVIAQLGSDIVATVVDHSHKWSWQNYVGAAVGGALEGELSLYAGPVIGAVLGSAVGNLTSQGLKCATHDQSNIDWAEFGLTVGISGLTAGILSSIGGTGATGLAKAANSAKRSSSLLNISRYWKSVGSSFKEVGNSIGRITKDEVVHYSREAAAKEIKDFLLIRTLPGKAAFNAFKGYIQGNWDNVDN